MIDPNNTSEKQVHGATQTIIDQLLKFDENTRKRVLRTALTFFGLDQGGLGPTPLRHQSHSVDPQNAAVESPSPEARFANRAELPAKDFLFQKQPRTDIERVACLAYYLTHYRDTRHFKTVDLSKLNTEAAQVKFSNPAYTVVNANNTGLLVPAGKGFKQLSAMGERFVEALPDRDAAKDILSSGRSRRGRAQARTARKKSD